MTIEERIAALRRNIQQMRLTNRYLRFGNEAGLKSMGYSMDHIARLKEPDLTGHVGYNPELIRRAHQTIRELKQRARA